MASEGLFFASHSAGVPVDGCPSVGLDEVCAELTLFS
jgi:hypothetical protein